MKLRPLQDRVIIKRLDAETTTRSGLIIPEMAKEQPNQGIVIAVGTGRFLENGERAPIGCAVDDTVLFAKYQATEITIDDEKFLVVRADDILGVVETVD